MPAWSVLPQFAKLVREAVRKAGGGSGASRKASEAARQQVIRKNPKWFKHMPGPGGKATAKAAPKAASTSRGGWNSVPANIKKKLLAGNTKGMSPEQVTKYRTLYKNRN